jgi:hypothetical protein
MSIHEQLPPQVKGELKNVGWTKGLELAKLARSEGQKFNCAIRLHKAREMPTEEFRRAVERELGRETEPWKIVHCLQEPSMKSSAMSSEKLDTLLPLGWEGCQGRPFFGRSSRPLTALPTPHNGARNEAKRSSVELRSMAEGFVFDFC